MKVRYDIDGAGCIPWMPFAKRKLEAMAAQAKAWRLPVHTQFFQVDSSTSIYLVVEADGTGFARIRSGVGALITLLRSGGGKNILADTSDNGHKFRMELPDEGTTVGNIIPSAGGKVVVYANQTDKVVRVIVGSAVVFTLPYGTELRDLALSADGTRVSVVTVAGSPQVFTMHLIKVSGASTAVQWTVDLAGPEPFEHLGYRIDPDLATPYVAAFVASSRSRVAGSPIRYLAETRVYGVTTTGELVIVDSRSNEVTAGPVLDGGIARGNSTWGGGSLVGYPIDSSPAAFQLTIAPYSETIWGAPIPGEASTKLGDTAFGFIPVEISVAYGHVHMAWRGFRFHRYFLQSIPPSSTSYGSEYMHSVSYRDTRGLTSEYEWPEVIFFGGVQGVIPSREGSAAIPFSLTLRGVGDPVSGFINARTTNRYATSFQPVGREESLALSSFAEGDVTVYRDAAPVGSVTISPEVAANAPNAVAVAGQGMVLLDPAKPKYKVFALRTTAENQFTASFGEPLGTDKTTLTRDEITYTAIFWRSLLRTKNL